MENDESMSQYWTGAWTIQRSLDPSGFFGEKEKKASADR